MKILGIETSSVALSLALLNEGKIYTHHVDAPMQQAKTILSSINELLSSSHVKPEQLTAIAFGRGPGSFTGIRIAVSVAQGLGYSLNKPLIPISSLAALAQTIHDDSGWKELLVAVDARMEEVYWGIYKADNAGFVKLVNTERLCKADKIDLPSSGSWGGVGSGWATYQNILVEKLGFCPSKIDSLSLPSASGVVRLAAESYQKGEGISASEAQPIYLRDKVVFSSSEA